VGFEPTNGGFAVLRSGAKLFIFLGDFVGLDRLTTLLLPDSVSRFVSRIHTPRIAPRKLSLTGLNGYQGKSSVLPSIKSPKKLGPSRLLHGGKDVMPC
jgi:hypothetical protein